MIVSPVGASYAVAALIIGMFTNSSLVLSLLKHITLQLLLTYTRTTQFELSQHVSACELSSIGPAAGNGFPSSTMPYICLTLISQTVEATKAASLCHPFLLVWAALPPKRIVTLGVMIAPAFELTMAVCNAASCWP
jgi:hypothetical protein